MELVALTGKPRSGKSTLAKALEKQGYMLVNFTDELKREAISILYNYDIAVTIEQINSDKETYRGFLQELGKHIQFDTNQDWVNKALKDWLYTCDWGGGYSKAAFDNVRTPQQWEVLKGYGFKLVRLVSERSIRNYYASGRGVVNHITLGTPYTHPIESALDHVEADLTLNGDLEVEYLVWKVLNS